jgi:hypothetical protein
LTVIKTFGDTYLPFYKQLRTEFSLSQGQASFRARFGQKSPQDLSWNRHLPAINKLRCNGLNDLPEITGQ